MLPDYWNVQTQRACREFERSHRCISVAKERAMSEAAASQPRPTIVDVAQAAGVSRQTVSNVLNKPEKVAAEPVRRVRHHVAELGFTPHVTAPQLRRQRAGAYGFAMNPSHARGLGHVLDEFLVELTVAAPGYDSH